ncbi:hypothetical protein AK830_g5562 [Neonectria ditissima]|uniref:Heterokaryon incompatibility domain-containing protein n=1 Tax=Neonectria ditissima TaxID=78410 RepID=A0A0P7BIT8_9HYPO|nr:hypothetical protein AK830_g5562 [Neonectria ditissima]
MASEQHDAKGAAQIAQTPPQALECTVCRQLMNFLSGTANDPSLEISEADFKLPCPGHGPLISGLQHGVEFMRSPDLFKRSNFVKAEVSETGPGKEVAIDFIPDRDRAYYLQTHVLLVHRPDIPDHSGRGRILDPEWIDLDTLCQWQRWCRTLHGETCDNPLGIARAEPTWLVDLETKSLVSGLVGRDYTALSYRWGDSIGFRTTVGILNKLQRPQALSAESEVWPLIPATVRHAMRITERLGLRYFYVDALCIPQDDETTKIHEIGQMAAIFSTAIITIVAADGDASDGIYGLYDISKPRALKQTAYPFIAGETIVETDSLASETCLPRGYDSRGWTFQEYHMSKRRIIFSEGRAHWECACAIWREDQMLPANSDDTIRQTRESFSLPKILHGYPSMCEYQDFLNGYADRSLTYEEDSLPAISGTLSLMARTFQGGFLCGIPELYFDVCIIWHSSDCDMERRQVRRLATVEDLDQTCQGTRTVCLPSWSWIGWKGAFIHYGGSDEYVIQDHARWDYMPIVEWYTSDTANGPWRRVESRWYEYVEAARDPDWQPPKGWTKVPYKPVDNDGTNEAITPSKGLGQFAFKHSSFPSMDFFCPFPTADADQTDPRPDMVRGTPFLSCRAQRVHLAPSNRNDDDPHEAVFEDENGKVIGILHPNHEKDWDALFVELETVLDAEGSMASPRRPTQDHQIR